MIAIDQETWQEDALCFCMRAPGRTASASIEVLDDAHGVEVSLPWPLAMAAKRLLAILREETTRQLE